MSSSKSDSSTRWWESYLVRYFNGFVFGVIFVVLIGIKLDLFVDVLRPLSSEVACGVNLKCIKPDLMPLSIFILLAAMCFSYVASTPITVLHAGRFGKWFFEKNSRYFWLSWVIFAASSLLFDFNNIGANPFLELVFCLPVLIWLFVPFIKKSDKYLNYCGGGICGVSAQVVNFWLLVFIWCMFLYGFSGRISYLLPKSEVHWITLALPSLWICCAQYSSLLKQIFCKDEFIEFYKNLFLARARANSRDIRDSYTHLREHSNSIFIVVLEMSIFSLAMMFLPSYDKHTVSMSNFGSHVMVFFVIWMIPTVFMWSRANAIEKDFLENTDKYFPVEKTGSQQDNP